MFVINEIVSKMLLKYKKVIFKFDEILLFNKNDQSISFLDELNQQGVIIKKDLLKLYAEEQCYHVPSGFSCSRYSTYGSWYRLHEHFRCLLEYNDNKITLEILNPWFRC